MKQLYQNWRSDRGLREFTVSSHERVQHLQRTARDLTILQTASLTLLEAAQKIEQWVSGGFVYWAIPAIRDVRAGYGIYVLAPDGTSHDYFVS